MSGLLHGKPLYGEHCDVVVLAERASCIADRLGIGKARKQSRQAAEPVQLVLSRARFEHAVRMERQAIAAVERKVLVFVFSFGVDAQRKGRIKGHFAAVEKRWQVTGVGNR